MVLTANKENVTVPMERVWQRADLRRVATSQGVRAGDGNRRLYERLGPPTTRRKVPASKLDVWRYRFDGSKDKEGAFVRYEAVYTFFKGRLCGIAFYRTLIGGA